MNPSTNSRQGKSCCCKHTFWTWLLALLLALYLFWHWQHGHGPAHASACCAGNSTAIAATDASQPFSFTASNAHGYNATGDASNVAWATKTKVSELSTWFKGGTDWAMEGDATHVTLTGTVASEAIKQAKGEEAQAFFGTGVTIDNQLTVKAAETTPVATAMPPAAKLYFDTGKTALPADASQTLAEIEAWLKANPSAKAVISGFSDPRGNLTKNEELSKNRAKAAREMLKAAGIDETRIEMRKPQSVEAGGDLAEARRVEVSVE